MFVIVLEIEIFQTHVFSIDKFAINVKKATEQTLSLSKFLPPRFFSAIIPVGYKNCLTEALNNEQGFVSLQCCFILLKVVRLEYDWRTK